MGHLLKQLSVAMVATLLLLCFVVVFCDGDEATHTRALRGVEEDKPTRKQLAHMRAERHRNRLKLSQNMAVEDISQSTVEDVSQSTVEDVSQTITVEDVSQYIAVEDISPETNTLIRLLKEYKHTDLVHYDSDDLTNRRKSEGLTWLQKTTDRVVFGDPSVVVRVDRDNIDDNNDDNNDDTRNATVHRERASITDQLVLYWTPFFGQMRVFSTTVKGCDFALGLSTCRGTTDKDQLLNACVVAFHLRDLYTIDENFLFTIPIDLPKTKHCFDENGVRRQQLWVLFSKETPPSDRSARKLYTPFDLSVTYVLPSPWLGSSGVASGFKAVRSLFQQARPNFTMSPPLYTENQYFQMWHLNILEAAIPYFPLTPDSFLVPPLVPVAERRTDALVVWLAHNCDSTDNREQVVQDLMKYMPVHSYGDCLNNMPNEDVGGRFGGSDPKELLSTYKFYLAFENTVFNDYVTEKYWRTLQTGAIPVIMGAPNINRFLPTPISAVMVSDFPTIKALAEFLLVLGNDDELYNRYLSYKQNGMVSPSFLELWKTRENYAGCSHSGLCEAGAVFSEIQDRMSEMTPLSSPDAAHLPHGTQCPQYYDSESDSARATHRLHILVHARPPTASLASSDEVDAYVRLVKRTVDGILRQRPLMSVASDSDTLAMRLDTSVIVLMDDLSLNISESGIGFERALTTLTQHYSWFTNWMTFTRSSAWSSPPLSSSTSSTSSSRKTGDLVVVLRSLFAAGVNTEEETDITCCRFQWALVMSTDAEWCDGAFVALQQIIYHTQREGTPREDGERGGGEGEGGEGGGGGGGAQTEDGRVEDRGEPNRRRSLREDAGDGEEEDMERLVEEEVSVLTQMATVEEQGEITSMGNLARLEEELKPREESIVRDVLENDVTDTDNSNNDSQHSSSSSSSSTTTSSGTTTNSSNQHDPERAAMSVRVSAPLTDLDLGGVLWNRCHLEEMLASVEDAQRSGDLPLEQLYTDVQSTANSLLRSYGHQIFTANSVQDGHSGQRTCGAHIDTEEEKMRKKQRVEVVLTPAASEAKFPICATTAQAARGRWIDSDTFVSFDECVPAPFPTKDELAVILGNKVVYSLGDSQSVSAGSQILSLYFNRVIGPPNVLRRADRCDTLQKFLGLQPLPNSVPRLDRGHGVGPTIYGVENRGCTGMAMHIGSFAHSLYPSGFEFIMLPSEYAKDVDLANALYPTTQETIFRGYVRKHQADFILINNGAHDIQAGGEDDYARSVRWLFDLIENTTDAQVIFWSSPMALGDPRYPQTAGIMNAFNSRVEEIVKEKGEQFHFIDTMYIGMGVVGRAKHKDNIHMISYEMLLRLWMMAIKEFT